jgi:hypothetical protein
MRYLKNFKMFESAQDSDSAQDAESAQDVAFFDIFPSDLIDDLYDASTEYFDRGLSLLINTRIGDEHGFSQVFNNKHKTSDMKVDLNNYDEIIELFNAGEIPEMEFCIVQLSSKNKLIDGGDYTEYDKKILDAVKVSGNNSLGWPDYDLKICEYPWDN